MLTEHCRIWNCSQRWVFSEQVLSFCFRCCVPRSSRRRQTGNAFKTNHERGRRSCGWRVRRNLASYSPTPSLQPRGESSFSKPGGFRRLFTKGFGGFRPVIGGMPSGSGLVGGGGYIAGYNSDLLQFTANARFSVQGYQTYDAGLLIFPRSNSLLPVQGHVN